MKYGFMPRAMWLCFRGSFGQEYPAECRKTRIDIEETLTGSILA